MDGYFQKISLMRKRGRQTYVSALKRDRELIHQDTGDSLPEDYFHPKKRRRSPRWIDNLVWSSRDSYYEAAAKISDRLDQIQSSRGR